jgi:uncharacterized protein YdbL (DUF1318 family)
MGIKGRGIRPPAEAERRARRDGMVRQYAATYHAALDLSATAQALAADINDFETRAWPRLADHEVLPPQYAGTKAGAMFAIFRVMQPPKSVKQIRSIVEMECPHRISNTAA